MLPLGGSTVSFLLFLIGWGVRITQSAVNETNPHDPCTKAFGEKLKCVYKDVTRIPSNISVNTISLTILDSTLGTLEKNRLANLHDLQNLTITDGGVSSIEPGTLQQLKLLLQLDLRHNQLSSVHNATYWQLPYLRYLDLSYNVITAIHQGAFSSLPNLKTLLLEGNKLSTLASGIFYDLNLFTLNLRQNLIFKIEDAFQECTLNKLYLQNNFIETFEEDKLLPLTTSVTVLDLSNNPLKSLPLGIQNLRHLHRLMLSNVKIKHLPYGFFKSLTKLSYLDISANEIISIDKATVVEFDRMDHVELLDNQWKCDCSIQPLHDWLIHASPRDQKCANMTDFAEIAQLGCLLCMQPDKMLGKAISSLRDLDKNCTVVQTTSFITLDETVGIVAALLVVVIVIIGIALYCIKKKLKDRKEHYNVSQSREVLSSPVNGISKPVTAPPGDDNGPVYMISQTLRRASSIESSI